MIIRDDPSNLRLGTVRNTYAWPAYLPQPAILKGLIQHTQDERKQMPINTLCSPPLKHRRGPESPSPQLVYFPHIPSSSHIQYTNTGNEQQ